MRGELTTGRIMVVIVVFEASTCCSPSSFSSLSLTRAVRLHKAVQVVPRARVVHLEVSPGADGKVGEAEVGFHECYVAAWTTTRGRLGSTTIATQQRTTTAVTAAIAETSAEIHEINKTTE